VKNEGCSRLYPRFFFNLKNYWTDSGPVRTKHHILFKTVPACGRRAFDVLRRTPPITDLDEERHFNTTLTAAFKETSDVVTRMDRVAG